MMHPVKELSARGWFETDARKISSWLDAHPGEEEEAVAKVLMLGGSFKTMPGSGEEDSIHWFVVEYPGYTPGTGRTSMARAAVEFLIVYGVVRD